MLLMALLVAAACSAKDIKTVVFNTDPTMRCENCANRIKDGLKNVKGIEAVKTNLLKKTVTVTYDAEKTTVESLIAAFDQIHYKATVANPDATPAPAAPAEGGCGGHGGAEQGCCGGQGH